MKKIRQSNWSRKFYPGGLVLSTQPGVSKNDPLGPAPANPDGAAMFNLITIVVLLTEL